jgi:hypothetical protein
MSELGVPATNFSTATLLRRRVVDLEAVAGASSRGAPDGEARALTTATGAGDESFAFE